MEGNDEQQRSAPKPNIKYDALGRPRELRPHRCDNRLEDLIESLFEGNVFKTVPGPFKLWWRCMRSNPGEEPTDPYTYIVVTPEGRERVN